MEINWYTAPGGAPTTVSTTAAAPPTPATKRDVAMGESVNGSESARAEGIEVDYDVADDDDRWMG